MESSSEKNDVVPNILEKVEALDSPDSFQTADSKDTEDATDWQLQPDIPTTGNLDDRQIDNPESSSSSETIVKLQNKLDSIVRDRAQRRQLALKLEGECLELRQQSIRALHTSEQLARERDYLLMTNRKVAKEKEVMSEECMLLQQQLNDLNTKYDEVVSNASGQQQSMKEQIDQVSEIATDHVERIVLQRDQAKAEASEYAERLTHLVQAVEQGKAQQQKTIAECKRLKDKCIQLLSAQKKQEKAKSEEHEQFEKTVAQLKQHNKALEEHELTWKRDKDELHETREKLAEQTRLLDESRRLVQDLQPKAEQLVTIVSESAVKTTQLKALEDVTQKQQHEIQELKLERNDFERQLERANHRLETLETLQDKVYQLEHENHSMRFIESERKTLEDKCSTLLKEQTQSNLVSAERDQLKQRCVQLEEQLKGFNDLSTKLVQVESLNTQLKEQNVALEAEKGKLKELDQLRKDHTILLNKKTALESQVEQLRESQRKNKEQLAAKENQHRQEVTEFEKTLEREKSRLAKFKDTCEDLKDKAAMEKREGERRARLLEDKNEDIRKLQARIKHLESPQTKLDPEVKLKIVTLEQSLDKTKRDYAKSEKENDKKQRELNEQLQTLEKQFQSCKHQLQETKTKLEKITKEFSEAKEKHRSEVDSMNATFEATSKKYQQALRDHNATIVKQKHDINVLKSDLEHLKQIEDTNQNEIKDLTVELRVQRASKSHLERDLALLHEEVDGGSIAFAVHQQHPDTMTAYQRIHQLSNQVVCSLFAQQLQTPKFELPVTISTDDKEPDENDTLPMSSLSPKSTTSSVQTSRTKSGRGIRPTKKQSPKRKSTNGASSPRRKPSSLPHSTLTSQQEQLNDIGEFQSKPVATMTDTQSSRKRFSMADLELRMFHFPQLVEPLLGLDFGGVYNTATLTRSHLVEELRLLTQQIVLRFDERNLLVDQISTLLACAAMNAMRTSAGQSRQGDESQLVRSLSKSQSRRGVQPNLAYSTISHPQHTFSRSSRFDSPVDLTRRPQSAEIPVESWQHSSQRKMHANEQQPNYLGSNYSDQRGRSVYKDNTLLQQNGHQIHDPFFDDHHFRSTSRGTRVGSTERNQSHSDSRRSSVQSHGTSSYNNKTRKSNKSLSIDTGSRKQSSVRPSDFPPSPHSPFNRHRRPNKERNRTSTEDWVSDNSSLSERTSSSSSPGADDEQDVLNSRPANNRTSHPRNDRVEDVSNGSYYTTEMKSDTYRAPGLGVDDLNEIHVKDERLAFSNRSIHSQQPKAMFSPNPFTPLIEKKSAPRRTTMSRMDGQTQHSVERRGVNGLLHETGTVLNESYERPSTAESTRLRIYSSGVVDVDLGGRGVRYQDSDLLEEFNLADMSVHNRAVVPELSSDLFEEFKIANQIQQEIDRSFLA